MLLLIPKNTNNRIFQKYYELSETKGAVKKFYSFYAE